MLDDRDVVATMQSRWINWLGHVSSEKQSVDDRASRIRSERTNDYGSGQNNGGGQSSE